MPRLIVPVNERDHVRGSPRAPVTLIEYGDFQCPFCGAAYFVLRNIEERFGRDLRVVYRHFPLTEMHPLAMVAAEASEAAGTQGQFWQMHDMLFENQRNLLPEHLVGYATALGLDVNAFVADVESHRHTQKIREDFMSGVRSGVNGTPCLFINGERFNGPADEALLARAINAARTSQHAHAR